MPPDARHAYATQTLRTLRSQRDDLDAAEKRWLEETRQAEANGIHRALGYGSLDALLEAEFGMSCAGRAPGRRLWLDPDPRRAALAVVRRLGATFAQNLADAIATIGRTMP
jgi:hypothetical protein